MKEKAIFLFIVLTLTLTNNLLADYGGGSGSAEDPFLISQPSHLAALAANSDHWGRNFRMAGDIDMAGVAHSSIGAFNSPFVGTFDGAGHIIYNLNKTLFSRLSAGTIKNLGLVNVTSSRGGLVGWLYTGTIDNCYSIGVITDINTDFGGLVGWMSAGTIQNSYSGGQVIGGADSQRFGGLVGKMEQGQIINCYSTAEVIGGAIALNVGGLVGWQEAGTIENCYSAGVVKGAKYVGGLVGSISTNSPFQSTVTDCYSTAEVTLVEGAFGSECGGGLVGYIQGIPVTITDCSGQGAVSGPANSTKIGGLIGWQVWGMTTDCFSTAVVTGSHNSSQIGGLIGNLTGGIVMRCYSSGNVSMPGGVSIAYMGGLVGMQTESGFISNSYSTSPVLGGSDSWSVGGLVGYLSATVDRCFSTGQVTGEVSGSGGLVGRKATTASVTSSFWDKDTSLQNTSSGGKGMTSQAMRVPDSFKSAGWDFVGEMVNGSDDIWDMAGYPILSWQPIIEARGAFTLNLTPSEQGQIEFNIYSITGQTLNWTITGDDSCQWITEVLPASGSATAEGTTVHLSVNAAGMGFGNYTHLLTLSADNGDVIELSIKLNVYDRVDFEEFAQLANYWATTGCLTGQPCKDVDWYVDGIIDWKDLNLLAQSWLGETIQITHPVIEDDFETGDFSQINWQHGGDGGWVITTGIVYHGTYSARSGTIGDSQVSTLEFTCDTTGWQIDTISFACKVSSESGFDYLRFFIDGNQAGSWTGQKEWGSLNSYIIVPGVHTFRWTYMKDSGDFGGADCAWIDNVRIYKMQ